MVDITNWNYYKKINITGQSGASTNYQIKLLVGESSSSGTNTFHVEGHSAIFPSAKNNGGDLVFLGNDNSTELSYWVESVSGTTPNRVATIWVKVSDDLSSNKSIYCYYGNSSATNLSNGENTFIFFDDFNDATLNTTKWNYEGFSNILTDSKVGVGDSSHDYDKLESIQTFATNTKMIANAFLSRTSQGYHYLGFYASINGSTYNRCVSYESSWETQSKINVLIQDGANRRYDTGIIMDSNGYGYANWEIHRRSNGSSLFYINNTLRNNITDKYVTIALPIGCQTYDANRITYIDYVCVAKFNDTEPSISSVEEENGEEVSYYNLKLPNSANVGDVIKIYSKNITKITQNTNNFISYKNEKTTIGTSGYVEVGSNVNLSLLYLGNNEWGVNELKGDINLN